MLSSVDCITTTSESEFSVHTGHRHRCLLGNIVRDHATILPNDATPKPDGIFGKDTPLPGASSIDGDALFGRGESWRRHFGTLSTSRATARACLPTLAKW